MGCQFYWTRFGDQPSQKFWRTHQRHIFLGAGNYENKHGLEFYWTRNGEKRINDTEYINERAITTTVMVNHHRIKLMSGNSYASRLFCTFSQCDGASRLFCTFSQCDGQHTPTLQWRARMWSGASQWLVRTHSKKGNKRGDRMKPRLVIQNFTALNTMYRKTRGKQTTYRSLKGTEKQTDHTLFKRRHLTYSEVAEANDLTHMGTDQRCVMATFVINAQKRMVPAMQTTTSNDWLLWEMSVHRSVKKMVTKKHSRSKKDVKNSKKRSNKKPQPQNQIWNKTSEDGRASGTKEAEAEKEKEMNSSISDGEKSRGGKKRDCTAWPRIRCKHRSSKREASEGKMQCTSTEKQQRRDKV